jgi:hypothetical protein
MLEPTTGSRLLAKEFGIVYDEGAEGIEARACPCLRVSSDRNPSMNPDGVASGSTTSATSEDNVDEDRYCTSDKCCSSLPARVLICARRI